MAGKSAGDRRAALARGHAMPNPDGPPKLPVETRQDLKDAIRLAGNVRPVSARPKARKFVMQRARQMGLSSLIPDTWNSDGTLKSSASGSNT